jgi:hypothetical protein
MTRATPQPAREEDCSERSILLREYQSAVADYSRAVQMLATRSGVMSKADYTCIREYIEEARIRAEAARGAIDRHTGEHGC